MKTRSPHSRLVAATLAATLSVGGCASSAGHPALPSAARHASHRSQTLLLVERVADWQLAHLDRFDYVSPVGRTPQSRGWVQGVFWLGLARLADRPGEQRYGAAIDRMGQAQGWRLGDRPLIADDHLIGQTWLARFARRGDPAMIEPLHASFDRILADPPAGSLVWETGNASGAPACLSRWCWADALFMAPATWAGLSRATGDPRYAARAIAELGVTTRLLYNPAERLFFRDSRFIARRGTGGAKIFWSRGNGWVLAGLANTLRALPPDAAGRAGIAQTFVAMADRIAGLQRPDGSWPSSLLEPDQPSSPETSGAALFVYAMAWGIHTGLLGAARFETPVRRGWTRLADAIGADGRVGWVQQIGDAPAIAGPRDTQLYGSGAILLAGTAMLDLDADRSRTGRR